MQLKKAFNDALYDKQFFQQIRIIDIHII